MSVDRTVLLDWFEVQLAGQVGVMRQVEAMRRGRKHRHGFKGEGWEEHIDGALAEAAVAKVANRYWRAVVDDPAELGGDVDGLEVRSTRHQNGHLLLHPSDHDNRWYVLVIPLGRTQDGLTFRLPGCIRGRDGKQDRYWRGNIERPAFFVPQACLHASAA